ncbi:MAG: hypothetical protein WAL32_00425 [Terriglobales bacterium]
MTLLTLILWWGELPLQAVLLYVLVRKQSFRTFPWFFVYTVFAVTAGVSRFLVRNHPPVYLHVYWTTEAIYPLLGIAVMYEVFRNVFRNFSRLWWFPPLFPFTVVLCLGLTISRSLSVPGGLEKGAVAWIVGSELGVRLLQVAMFALLVTMVLLFGLRWRQQAFGICAGYGLFASVALLTTTRFYEFGTKFKFLWGLISVITYSIAVLIWLWYFSVPLKTEATRAEQPPLSAQELGRYKEIVRRVRRP